MRRTQRPAAAGWLLAVALLPGICGAEIASAQPVAARSSAAAPVAVNAVTGAFAAPRIDGRLDEEIWRQAPVAEAFVQDEPDEGAPSTERTQVVVAVDAHAVYVGARLFNRAPGSIVARLARRDQDAPSDGFVVYLDPHHDRRGGFYFGVNAAGTQYDGTMLNDNDRDDTWDAVWASSEGREDNGWTVEMRIPLSQLRFDGRAGKRWGINFERIIERRKEHALLAITPRTESGFVSRFVDLNGVEAVVAPPRLEVVPYLSWGWRDRAHDPGDPFTDVALPLRAGLDLKAGLGGRLTLDATLFPDFGQVEVDPAVINLSDVETFYPEKRPFFIEGSAVFDGFGRGGANMNINLDWSDPSIFYSRRIGRAPHGDLPDDTEYSETPAAADILAAAKLSGKLGDWSLGSLGAVSSEVTARAKLQGQLIDVPVEPRSTFAVARAQRTISDGRHGLGAIATLVGRDRTDPALVAQFNHTAAVLGLDGWASLGKERDYVLTGWSSFSRITGAPAHIAEVQRSSVHYFQRPLASHLHLDESRSSLDGFAARLVLNKQRGRLRFNAGWGAISPGFEVNDVGYMGVADKINAHIMSGYRWTDPGRVFRSIDFIAAPFANWDFGGVNTDRALFSQASARLLNYWSLSAHWIEFAQTTNVRRARGGPPMREPSGRSGSLNVYSDSARPLSGGISVSGDQGTGGDGWSASGSLTARLTEQFSVSVDPEYSRAHNPARYLETVDDPAAVATFGRRYLFGDLRQRTVAVNLRVQMVFTPHLSFQLFAQPLTSSLHHRSVQALAAPNSFEFEPVARDPAEFNKNILSLRGSAVLRWEYLPGSTLFLVWNGNQEQEDPDDRFRVTHRFANLGSLKPNHVFLAKLSYWWSR